MNSISNILSECDNTKLTLEKVIYNYEKLNNKMINDLNRLKDKSPINKKQINKTNNKKNNDKKNKLQKYIKNIIIIEKKFK